MKEPAELSREEAAAELAYLAANKAVKMPEKCALRVRNMSFRTAI